MTRRYITIVTDQTGAEHIVRRDVCHRHPAAVHTALGTETEAGLQLALDGIYVDDYYGPDGRHLGADDHGLALYWLDSRGRRMGRVASA